MVVMDYLDEESYKPVSTSDDSYFPALHSVLERFHQAGFVHGDLRPSNILVRRKDGPNPIAILDFDWSGKAGETFYPLTINRTTIQRPEGVCGGQPILIDHDNAMLQMLYNKTDVENVPLILDLDSE